jgi:hypothetical protein
MSMPVSRNQPPRSVYPTSVGTSAPAKPAAAGNSAARSASSSAAASTFRPGTANPFQGTRDAAAGRPAAPAPRDPKLALMASIAELKSALPPEAAGKKLPAEKLFEHKAFQQLEPEVQKQAMALMQANVAAGPKSQDRVLQLLSHLPSVRTEEGQKQVLSALQQTSPMAGAPTRDATFHAGLRLLGSTEFAALPPQEQHRVTAQLEQSRVEPGQTQATLDQLRARYR